MSEETRDALPRPSGPRSDRRHKNLDIWHSDEDCKISSILSNASGKTLLVEDRIFDIFEADPAEGLSHILRMEISASDRRELLAGNPGEVMLRSPSPGHRIEDMDDEGEA